MLKRVFRLIVKHPGPVFALGLLATIPCVYWTARLYSNLRLDLEELLPRQAQSILDLGEVRTRLQTVESLSILLFSKDIDASRRFVDAFAARLSELPPDVSAGVEYRIRREIEFFDRRKALFVELEDLKKLRDYIADRLDYEISLRNPLNIFSGVDIPEPRFRVQRFLLRYQHQDQAERFSKFPGGYYATPDQTKRAVIVYLPAGQNTIKGRLKLKEEVQKIYEGLKIEERPKDLEVHYTGEVQNNIDEYHAVLDDIQRSATLVTLVVTAAVLIYFKTVLGAAALFFSLLMARFWAFSVTWFSVGYLNANSAFMGSIVLGSGITYGVMLLSRYMEERRAGHPPAESATVAMDQTVRATWTASLAAALAYGSLAVTKFEGFRQYGLIGFCAMIFCWGSALFILPALILLLEKVHPLVGVHTRRNRHRLFAPIVFILAKYPKRALVLASMLTGISIYFLAGLKMDQVIETDLLNLRSKTSLTSGAAYWARQQDEIFRSYLSPVVVMPRTEDDALRIATALKEKMRDDGDSRLMVSVRSIHDFVPPQQQEKVAVLHEIARLLPRNILRQLPPSERKLADQLLTSEAMRPFGDSDLPEMILRRFTEKTGEVGRLVLVEPPLGSAKWTFDRLNRFVTDLRAISAQTTGGRIPVAGSHPITRDMFDAITHDGPRATLVALFAVLGLVVLLFRKTFPAAMVIGSLVLGMVWMAGFALAFKIKINFLNFIALPIGFGLGVDYGVNILERYLHDRDHNVMKALRETGSAVTLCSFTTVAGYTSLIIASNQAFVSFGWLAVAGEVGTMLAAIMTLPSVLLLIQRRRRRSLRKNQRWRLEQASDQPPERENRVA